MGVPVLKEDYRKRAHNDPVLFGEIGRILGYKPSYLNTLFINNSPKLTQAGVLDAIRKHLQLGKDTELLEELQTQSAA